jgi:hypothetical protein
MSKIKTKKEAVAAYTQCISNRLEILQDLATERNVDMSNSNAMEKIGADLVHDLMTMKCNSFIKLESMIAKNVADDIDNLSTGVFKRVELSGFNHIVLGEDSGNEKSFLWLRQFAGSEKFMNETVALTGKKIKISWNELEVYLPQAKGYYKIKEITGIEFLN